ncbi:heparinase II/III domain-containing protein [Massilia antarctica]|uniref:heparinase II/III domain-containing protein n=1 Tax=Massilia antarctica TaxID=2765360 RepID=UPI0006BB72D6|nr:heparinase II/III family protein [Massilia sp. H27-R4]MCY0912765.1 heparinase II/III family protein [Massilia sp. H27-R4]CUI03837.1 Oligo alginate lyase [Janthinobacterium sp. CG23_2]CUU27623.1 Oligo alginate lyase [Janthinobacterium sp. CG23_2]
MPFIPTRPLRYLLLCAGALCAPAHADWAIGPNLATVRPAPEGDQVQGQNPPGFAWSQKTINGTPSAGYEVEVTGAGGVAQRFQVSRNWLLPEAAFAAGSYTWRVRAREDAAWSDARKFRIDAAASLPFIVPNEAALKKAIRARGQVRSLPPELLSTPFPSLPKQRQALRARLQWAVSRDTALATPTDAQWPHRFSTPTTDAYNTQVGVVRNTITPLGYQLEAAALLWRLRGTDSPDLAKRYFDEAVKRGNELAALDPEGPTSYVNQDQATRMIALSLIKAIDLLGTDLDKKVRSAWLEVVERRTAVIYTRIKGANGRLDQYPFDSHGSTNYGMLSAIATLALDRIPAAETWFDYAFRGYVNSISAWGGADGGFANGTAYGEYTAAAYSDLWLPIGAASGVNLFSKPWAMKFAQFMAHFDPPGSPTHVFGDEHEVVPAPFLSKSYARQVPSPVAAWYAQSLNADENARTGFQAPLATSNIVAAPPADAAQYPSVGWVAMHSKITDAPANLTSVYFKSSPYGSYNHSHADQNSLVINSGGRRLLIEAGKSDGYGSDQAAAWYRQTRAHNAITYGNGIGQRLGIGDEKASLGWNGAISNFSTTAALDTVTGTATAAYDGKLESAVRQVWYLRQKNVVVVRDKLASSTPYVFEWNMHAINPLAISGDGVVKVTNGPATLCLRSMSGNGIMPFYPPQNAAATQYHAAFHSLAPVARAEFLVVIDIGCKGLVPVLGGSSTEPVLTIDGQQVRLY